MDPIANSNVSIKGYLRKRRPERFSDTPKEHVPTLDRSLLEFHLDTLTSRNQDTEFELFARSLAQKTICPNLRPQTGPTGGGDAKVDTETFPVSEEFSLAWFVGNGTAAASERWAFAFSAMQDWRKKVRSDIEKLAATARGYRKAFFISNRAIKARDSASLEDELRKAHGIEVFIHDRTWILDQVFSHGLESIALQELRIATHTVADRKPGPRDARRKVELDEVEKKIASAIQTGDTGPELVANTIRAADLARNIELPRTQIDGLFSRAERLARQYGLERQLTEVLYQKAWTSFHWHEDYTEFSRLYSEVESQVRESDSPDDLELLSNLWSLLVGAEGANVIDASILRVEERRIVLVDALKKVRDLPDRPSAALRARSLLLLQEHLSLAPNTPPHVFPELKKIVEESEGLVGFPLEPLADIVVGLGDYHSANPQYDELFEATVAVLQKRRGEVAKSSLLLGRSWQFYESQKYVEALITAGRSLVGLAKNETRMEFISAKCLCGACYQELGVYWAARGSYLNAASTMANFFQESSDLKNIKTSVFNGLKWIDLLLGRLPQLFAWHEVEFTFRAAKSANVGVVELGKHDAMFDTVLGILLQRATIPQLKQMEKLPGCLDALSLHCSQMAMLHTLGHESQSFTDLAGADKNADEFFEKWRAQPAATELALKITLGNEPIVRLESQLMGCSITLDADPRPCCALIGESLLAVLEAMLATTIQAKIFSHEPEFSISVVFAAEAKFPFEFTLRNDTDVPVIDLRCSNFNPHRLSRDEQGIVYEKLNEVACYIFARVAVITDYEAQARKIFVTEAGIERARFTSSLITTQNVLGPNPKFSLQDWISPDYIAYPLNRTSIWPTVANSSPQGSEKISGDEELSGASPPPFKQTKQKDFIMFSLIKAKLWDSAGWSGTFFVWSDDSSMPPVFGLVFKDRDAAGAIFRGLLEEVGSKNSGNKLGITIIRGINRENPHAYRVVIGNDMKNVGVKEGALFAIITRRRSMEPANDTNLRQFLQAYERSKKFTLVPAVMADPAQGPLPNFRLSIEMSELCLREAWTIGLHDPDSAGIEPEDNPVIPPDNKDAPVSALLDWMRTNPPAFL
jgi:hypothetical protein